MVGAIPVVVVNRPADLVEGLTQRGAVDSRTGQRADRGIVSVNRRHVVLIHGWSIMMFSP